MAVPRTTPLKTGSPIAQRSTAEPNQSLGPLLVGDDRFCIVVLPAPFVIPAKAGIHYGGCHG